MTATTTDHARDALTVPLRPCAPWCDHGGPDRHRDEHPADRSCWSAFTPVPLTRGEPAKMSDGEWWHDFLDVALRLEPAAAEPVIMLNHEGEPKDWEATLTLDEARVLRDVLDKLLATCRAAPARP